MIFSRGSALKCSFMYNSDELEVVKAYYCLEIIFNRSGYFCKVKKHLWTQCQKAMYGTIRKFDIRLDLFDKVVLLVLLYSTEIWIYESIDVIEREYLTKRCLKQILNLKNSTSSFIVYFSLHITIYTRMIGFFAKVILYQEN